MKFDLDIDRVLDVFDGDKEMMLGACELFLEHFQQHIGSLSVAGAEKNFDAIEHEAHTLKGMAGYFDDGTISTLGDQVQSAAKSRDPEVFSLLSSYVELITALGASVRGYFERESAQ